MPNPYNPNQDRAQRSEPYNTSRPGEYHKGDAAFQIPIWVIVLMFFIGAWPVALILFLLNHLFREGVIPSPSTTRRSTVSYTAAAGTPVYTQNRKPAAPSKAKSGRESKKESGLIPHLLLAGGICLAAFGAFAAAMSAVDLFAYGIPNGYASLYVEDIIAATVPLAGGLAMVFGSNRIKTSRRMRKKIQNIVGKADHVYIREIAEAIPCSYEKCCRYLEDCIDKGVFGEAAYLDMRSGSLVVRGAAPQPTPEPAKPEPKPEEVKAENSRYEEILLRLHRVNDAIPDAAMTDKISRLEAVSAKIFAQVEQNPDKLTQMRKFMDYYLPTALKLLETYAELDAQGVEGENIRESKHRIESAMDTLVTAFETQLDKLFQSDAMDVSADIDVMENMLRADGLTSDGSGPHLQL
ncbi:MAG: 5-bromo-4-chloroindolyl phosphate hydrolysis family protein [Oscillospiraceae bacterium]|nr:5-bromo-4-chloroindolyl phosphate hydrolysis family protein [Oscillospiraceae bacterium]